MNNVITVTNLQKHYGSLKAVNGLSFSVRRGEIFGILGPNGAGKTTTLEMVEGLKKSTGGTINVLGMDPGATPDAVKQRIGIQLQAAAYYDTLKLTELLALFGTFYKKQLAPADLLKKVQLTDKAKARVNELSGGQKQRFSIAASLVNDPEIVFLDEPTTGLDPQARHNLWNFILDLKKQGRTVVLTTHYMEEAELLADRVAVIDAGKIVACDTPRELIKQLKRACSITFVVAATPASQQLADGFKRLSGVQTVEIEEGQRYHVVASSADDALNALFDWAKRENKELADLHVEPATLEDVFLHLTGKTLRE